MGAGILVIAEVGMGVRAFASIGTVIPVGATFTAGAHEARVHAINKIVANIFVFIINRAMSVNHQKGLRLA